MSTRFQNRTFTTDSPAATQQLGYDFGTTLTGGEILLLNGPLGAGKTLFTKGLAEALGLDATEITSPTFTLVSYDDHGRLPLYHLDLYRLEEGVKAAKAVDLDEILNDEAAIVVIEWAERLGDYALPTGFTWHISLEGDGNAPRTIEFTK